ncbi:hypothetical protein EIJ81_00460 (plasmid) [Aliivibrio salmonicida]|uniref:hypothetical protein n=1 Tax=Aliivibrio salmonicida TaxID=40269 RepID=UPI000F7092A5|nr:hypothetical protein [Aliivibrio salmonicida]AZL83371.1 hypothetical protein EIJ81_00460 [Aliivibrio salmonicida]
MNKKLIIGLAVLSAVSGTYVGGLHYLGSVSKFQIESALTNTGMLSPIDSSYQVFLFPPRVFTTNQLRTNSQEVFDFKTLVTPSYLKAYLTTKIFASNHKAKVKYSQFISPKDASFNALITAEYKFIDDEINANIDYQGVQFISDEAQISIPSGQFIYNKNRNETLLGFASSDAIHITTNGAMTSFYNPKALISADNTAITKYQVKMDSVKVGDIVISDSPLLNITTKLSDDDKFLENLTFEFKSSLLSGLNNVDFNLSLNNAPTDKFIDAVASSIDLALNDITPETKTDFIISIADLAKAKSSLNVSLESNLDEPKKATNIELNVSFPTGEYITDDNAFSVLDNMVFSLSGHTPLSLASKMVPLMILQKFASDSFIKYNNVTEQISTSIHIDKMDATVNGKIIHL